MENKMKFVDYYWKWKRAFRKRKDTIARVITVAMIVAVLALMGYASYNIIQADAQRALEELFASDSLIVPKKGKNGIVDQDIIPMIRSICVKAAGEKELRIEALICCQNPSLNPSQLVAAIERYCPQLKPDHSTCRREELYDMNETVFR